MKHLLFLLSFMLLTACFDDDSDDDDQVQDSLEQDGVGFFIDSPVQGLSYSSSSHSGTTDELGRFNYEAGESMIFSIGDINLPAVTASKAVHVSDLYSGGLTDVSTINLARLLLTLDSDNDSDNGIQLSANVTSSASTSSLSSLDFSAANFDTLVAAYAGALVTVQDATDHITETKKEAEGLLANCGNECVPRVAFMDNIVSVFPRHAQQSVPLDTDISITFTSDFALDLTQMNIEMFAVGKNSYDNCRIDWPGFRCDDLGIASYDIRTDLITNFARSISGKTVSYDIENLESNSLYIVHLYHDGASGDQDDYKSWWLFYTD